MLAFPYFSLGGIPDDTPDVKNSDGPYVSRGDLFFVADVIQFEGADDGNVVEVVYAIDLAQFRSKDNLPTTDRFSVEMNLIPTGQSEPLVEISDSKDLSSSVGDSGVFIDLVREDLSDQDFDLWLTLRDGSGRTGVITQQIRARTFGGDLSISDLLFVTHLQQGDTPSSLSRHGIIMIPSPTRHFNTAEESSTVYIYYEINNLIDMAAESNTYSVRYDVQNVDGQKIIEKTIPDQKTGSTDCSRIERISLSGMVPGLYRFNLDVTDMANGATAAASSTFRITGPASDEPLLLAMTAETIDRNFEQIEHIASYKEKKVFKTLSLQGKQEFLLRFWKDRDPTPATLENEFLEEHFRRLAYSETHFQGGIHSDQGRVYIVYGPPMDIERMFWAAGYARPVEIWTYAMYGRTEFVFVDRTGDGHYFQAHSTHKDEISNSAWQEKLRADMYDQPGL